MESGGLHAYIEGIITISIQIHLPFSVEAVGVAFRGPRAGARSILEKGGGYARTLRR